MTLVTPEGRLSYPKVFKSEIPKNSKPGSEPAWSTAILFTSDTVRSAEFGVMLTEAIAAAKAKWPDATGKIEFDVKGQSCMMIGGGKSIRMPFRKNVGKYSEDVAYFITARKVDKSGSSRAPEVVDRAGRPITDQDAVYPGVRGRLSLTLFAYTMPENSGVSFGLNNVQILGAGARLDNFQGAKDEFDALSEEAPATFDSASDPRSAFGI